MQYEEIIEDIFKRHPSVQNTGFNNVSYKAGIESMRDFDNHLGRLWTAYPCIHVAGTNGKGSVSSLLAVGWAASEKAAIGLYTSPHLLDFRERIKIICPDGGLHYELISKEDVLLFLEEQKKEIAHLSFFEITTGMALWWFNKMKVGGAVIEVGLGGRLDSTNIITPVLSVITSIGLDHCSMLGDSREKIAREKAGIMKKSVPAVIWGKDRQTDGVFEDVARQVGSPLSFADEIIKEIPYVELDLKGEYQSNNLRTALASFKLIGIEPDLQALRHTASVSGLRGRWEILCTKPLTICDIGHNPAALEYNFRQLISYRKKLHIVYGIMRDKALDDIAPLMPGGDTEYYLCAPKGERALPVNDLYRKLHSDRPELHLTACYADDKEGSVARAVRLAKENAAPDDIIYIGGSNFVVAEALK